MSFLRKGFTLVEIVIVMALIGIFIGTLSYWNSDSRIYQTKSERLANTINDTIRDARNNSMIGRGALSGGTLLSVIKREIVVSGAGITTTYTTNTSTGLETNMLVPFYDNDANYTISDISVSSGILATGIMPIWDQTGVTSVNITILQNGDLNILAPGVLSDINTIRITAGYKGFERSVMINRLSGNSEVVTGKGEQNYLPPPPPVPINGMCDNGNKFSCIIGNPDPISPGVCDGIATWSCLGSNGGSNATGCTKSNPACTVSSATGSCASNPTFPNQGALTIGSPTSTGQTWLYGAANCGYVCTGGYSGSGCSIAPVSATGSCATNPTFPNLGTLTVGTPTVANQTWSYGAANCGYQCTWDYEGNNCNVLIPKFTTVWRVGTPGYGDGQKSVNFSAEVSGNMMIDWGDGTRDQRYVFGQSMLGHTYATAGDYTIKISGIEGFGSSIGAMGYGSGNYGKLISVTDWGSVKWKSLIFAYANNLKSLPIQAPDLSKLSLMFQMFYDATAFNQDLSNWDTSKVTNMEYLFNGATSFNGDISTWDTSKVTNMQLIFNGATAFNQPIGSWNTSKVTNMYGMFRDAKVFNQDISNWCVPLVTSKPSDFDFGSSAGFINNIAKQPKWGTCGIINHTVTFNTNGGSAVATQNITSGNRATTPASPTKAGNTFVGWYSNASLTVSYSFATPIIANITLYAKWNAIPTGPTPQPGICSITTAQKKSVMDGKWSPILYCDTSKSGIPTNSYTAGSIITTFPDKFTWTCYGTTGGTNTACSVPRSYDVYFDSNGIPGYSGGGGSQSVIYNNFPKVPSSTPYNWGHTFDGWSTSPTGGPKVDITTIPITTDLTYYARWIDMGVDVKFNPNGGNLIGPSTIKKPYGTTIGALPTATRNCDIFDGWYADGGASPNGLSGVRITASSVANEINYNAFAHWTPKNCIVTFDGNGGTNPGPNTVIPYNDGSYVLYVSSFPTSPTRAGFKFDGWHTSSTGGSRVYDGTTPFPTNISSNITWFAHWIPN